MTATRDDILLTGFTATGSKIHGVEPLPDDPRPLSHGHGRQRAALCGVTVVVKPWTRKPTRRGACQACARKANTEAK